MGTDSKHRAYELGQLLEVMASSHGLQLHFCAIAFPEHFRWQVLMEKAMALQPANMDCRGNCHWLADVSVVFEPTGGEVGKGRKGARGCIGLDGHYFVKASVRYRRNQLVA
jgi:hypothetical protein